MMCMECRKPHCHVCHTTHAGHYLPIDQLCIYEPDGRAIFLGDWDHCSDRAVYIEKWNPKYRRTLVIRRARKEPR